MNIAVVCDPDARASGTELAAALEEKGVEATLVPTEQTAESGLTGALARHLVAVEGHLQASPADAVALIGRGDAPFAGVLVATKLRVPAFRVATAAPAGDAGNGPLIDRLADRLVDGDPAAAAAAIERELAAS